MVARGAVGESIRTRLLFWSRRAGSYSYATRKRGGEGEAGPLELPPLLSMVSRGTWATERCHPLEPQRAKAKGQ